MNTRAPSSAANGTSAARRCAQALQQLNLAGMVEVVRGDAADQGGAGKMTACGEVVQLPGIEGGDGGSEFAVFPGEQIQVAAPLRETASRTRKPVGPFQRERSALHAG